MSAIGSALEQRAWRDAGSPTRRDVACPHCGAKWVVEERLVGEHLSDDERGVRSHRDARVVEGSECGCAARIAAEERDARHAEWDERAAKEAARVAAAEAEWSALPDASPDLPGEWDDGDGRRLSAARVIADAEAVARAYGKPWRGVKLRPDGGLWADPGCGWYHPWQD